MEVASASFQVLFSMFFIHQFGTIGGTMGYAAGHLLYFLIMAVLFRKILFQRV
jgi:hypothetical protein